MLLISSSNQHVYRDWPIATPSVKELYTIASAVHDFLIDVRSHINNLAIVHTLPDELLYHIFKHLLLRREAYPGYTLYERQKHAETRILVGLTHVCRTWRNVLLHAPQFWACIGYSVSEQFTAFLERSGSAPLSLFVEDGTPGLADVLSEHMRRLKRIDLVMTHNGSYFTPLLSLPLSKTSLECFSVSADVDCDATSVSVPSSLLFEQPNLGLKALALCPVPGWLPTNHFPALTHLYLHEESDSLWMPNFHSFLALLSNSPALQFVYISNAFLNTYDTIPPATPTVILDQLRSFVLLECETVLVDLLNHLSFPADSFVRLSHIRNIEEPTKINLRHLALLDGIQRMDLAVEKAKVLLVADGPSRGFWLDNYHHDVCTVSWMSWISDVLPATIPLSHLTSLRIYLGDDLPILSSLLPHMPTLLELGIRFIYGHPSQTITEAARKPDENAAAVAGALHLSLAQQRACPFLCALHLEVVVRRRLGPGVMQNFTDMCPATLVETLALRARSEYPVRRLTIQPARPLGKSKKRNIATVVPESIRRAFSPVKPFIEEFTVHDMVPHETGAMFWMRDCWNVDGEEAYWNLHPDYDKARYDWYTEPKE
ncbi:hypothetical protein OH76DRAFT_1040280 [Lentinus brumalis]|uniref:F-box domain-containing protein n=1 Tax=Lentinus brumalis TaxID=2498619 RepID=A0A371CX06_9APHY|nr:hypothetical protein OH76DRAFT_1040280 [Polyporus brumalis]